ncbi:MAG: hypothetical protein HN778_05335 [Prolixibacteraceae bacterium]|jgi:hypothetical protein|nr:hypothetical protein [Prolixibacteraceae bacterium]MBT6764267.1 hypothetical protein [Prolixibacteraceae bacterium]MBT6996980.1 hypothetical protein [Prolixibacteraceae bacterium]MBT7394240.1 hypothetical protein [Prolixibacteraceae bacterium]
MAFSVKYKPLFVVNILHQYFLNKGTDEYLTMSDADKVVQMSGYNINDFFAVVPSSNSLQKINGHCLIFKTTSDGFTIWGKVSETDETEPFIALADDLNITFLLKYKDTGFLNYTNLKLENSNKLYYFSNQRLETEPGTFPLINQSGNNTVVGEDFILSDDGTTDELEKLFLSEKENLYGLINIVMKGDNASLNLTDTQGKIVTPIKTFELLFENRKTTWRYIFNDDQKVKNKDDVKKENGDSKRLITKNEQPLTQKGFVSVELGGIELPNPNSRLIKPDSSSNKIFSEIYM